MDRSWCRHDATGLRIAVRIQPRVGAGGWAANERLRRFIAGLFDVPPASVSLLQGGRSRDKLLAIAGVNQLPPALAGLPEHQG